MSCKFFILNIKKKILAMEYVREKGILVKEISANCQGNSSVRFGRHPDLLLTFNKIFIACKPQTFSSCFQELLIFYTFLLQFWCITRALVAFKAKAKGVVFKKFSWGSTQNSFLSHCSKAPFPFKQL